MTPAKALMVVAVAVLLMAPRASMAGDEPGRDVAGAIEIQGGRCLARDRLAKQLVSWLGRREIDARIGISVREADGSVAYSVTRDGTVIGERTLPLSKADCSDVHAAVALAIAIAIDATVLDALGVATPTTRLPAEPAAPGGTALPAAPQPSVAPPATPTPPAVRTPADAPLADEALATFRATTQGVVLLGVLPEVVIGFAPSVDLPLAGRFELTAGAVGTTGASTPVGSFSAESRLAAGIVEPCAAVGYGRARFRLCAGAVFGVVATEGKGAGFTEVYSRNVPWMGAAMRFDARWGFGAAFGLVLSLDGFFPLVRPLLEVERPDGSVAASRSFSPAGVSLGVGPSFTF